MIKFYYCECAQLIYYIRGRKVWFLDEYDNHSPSNFTHHELVNSPLVEYIGSL